MKKEELQHKETYLYKGMDVWAIHGMAGHWMLIPLLGSDDIGEGAGACRTVTEEIAASLESKLASTVEFKAPDASAYDVERLSEYVGDEVGQWKQSTPNKTLRDLEQGHPLIFRSTKRPPTFRELLMNFAAENQLEYEETESRDAGRPWIFSVSLKYTEVMIRKTAVEHNLRGVADEDKEQARCNLILTLMQKRLNTHPSRNR